MGFRAASAPTTNEMFSGAINAPMAPPLLPLVSSPSDVQLNGSLENSTTQCFAVMIKFGATSVAVHCDVFDPLAIKNTTPSSDSPDGSPSQMGSRLWAVVSGAPCEQAVAASVAKQARANVRVETRARKLLGRVRE